MRTYSKVETLLERDDKFRVTNNVRRPVFETISEWIVTEKIDGTNIRLGWDRRDNLPKIGGKTDNAQIPVKLYDALTEMLEGTYLEAEKIMEEYDLTSMTLYGEGYGAGIQKGGVYRVNMSFILFDVLVNDTAWLDDNQVTDTANRLGIDRVPILGRWSLAEIAQRVEDGIPSAVNYAGVNHNAEGIVARPIEPLYDRRGERIMFKLKTKDFRAGKR